MSGVQAVIAYAVVAMAAAWIVWSMFVPGKLKARLRGRVRLKR
ncbi:hypothetical protein [Caulobacter sp. S45]|nr:hypothetical protein [Caulobacter sp. S45]